MEADRASGETLSHFRLERRLGAGGMGIVYRAEDLLLKRAVALKVLGDEHVSDERRRARFLREARTAASLVHPNIATIYEVGEAAGVIYIAMELVPGESLRAKLEHGIVDLSRALEWAMDIARALAKAHEAGIVHRDLKPDNVMITPDGGVKLLDFGIAKALEPESQSGDPALDSTALQAMTGEGTIVGTPEYMSPEQAKGERVDARSDVFSFGVLLAEMLLGVSPFRRANVVETVIAVSRDAVPSTRSRRPDVSGELEAFVQRCLAKERRDRFRDGGEMLAALRVAAKVAASSPLSPMAETLEASVSRTQAPPSRRKAAIVVGAAGLVAALAVGMLLAARATVSSRSAAQTSEPGPLPLDQRLIGGHENNEWVYGVSSDGTRLVYRDGAAMWSAELPAGAAAPLPVPEADARATVGLAFVSPDTIAYAVSVPGSSRSDVFTLGLHDAAPRHVRSDPVEAQEAAFSRDGKRFAYGTTGGVLAGQLDGGAATRIVTSAARDYVGAINFVPGEDAIVYVLERWGDRAAELTSIGVDGRGSTVLERAESLAGRYGGMGVTFAAPGRLLLLRYDGDDTTLQEIPTGARGAFAGPPRARFVWHSATVSGLRAGGERIVTSRSEMKAEVMRFPLSPDRTRVDAPSVVFESPWVLRPLGWLDDAHVATIEEQSSGYHVLRVGVDGSVTPYVPGPLLSASLVPGGDVLYWTNGDAGCSLARHTARGGGDFPVPQAGATCDHPIACGASRCVAADEGGDLVTRFRDWDPQRGATGPVIARVESPRIRFALSPDGTLLATTGDQSFSLYDLAHGTKRTIAISTPRIPQALAFSPDGARVLITGAGVLDGPWSFSATIFDLAGNGHVLVTGDTTHWMTAPRFAPDGKSFVVGRADFGARLWLLEPRAP